MNIGGVLYLKRRFVFLMVAVVSLAAVVVPGAVAQGFAASTNRAVYSGTITRYATLADAQAGTNATFSSGIGPRDLAIFTVNNRPDVYSNFNAILTSWYPSLISPNSGLGNPNNTNNGFMQLYDDNASTVSSWNGGYIDTNTFSMSVSGLNADALDVARLWNAGSPAGNAETTAGSWLSYSYDFSATGLNAVADGFGGYINTTNASGYSGGFLGLFQNLSIGSPESNGFYVLDVDFSGNGNWAVANGIADPDLFVGSMAPVPEPFTMTLLAGGALAAFRKRRRAQKALS